MASAMTDGHSYFFAREMLFCGRREDDGNNNNNNRNCSKKLGIGYCRDKDANYYNMCRATGFTLKECQQKAETTVGMIGLEYYAFDTECTLLYDDITELDCPAGFTKRDDYGGTGPIDYADDTEGLDCFVCEN